MPDVLQVITTSARRGAERFAVALEDALGTRGLDVTTVALAPGAEPALPVPALGSSRLGRETLWNLRRMMKEARATVAHGSTTLPACAVAGMGTSSPLIYRNIGDPRYWATSRSRRLRTRILMRRTAAVVALTAGAAAELEDMYGVDPAKLRVVPNGVSEDEFPLRTADTRRAARQALGVPADVSLAVYLGSLTPEKDVLNAVAAMGRLTPGWQLVIGGDGSERAAAEAHAAAVAPGRIRFLGVTDDPTALLTAADALVVPSRTEGMPGVVIEAALVGVPAVVTDVGMVRELVVDGVTGRVVPPGDPAALAQALGDVGARTGPLGAAAHEHARQHFAMSVVADAWCELLTAELDLQRGAGRST